MRNNMTQKHLEALDAAIEIQSKYGDELEYFDLSLGKYPTLLKRRLELEEKFGFLFSECFSTYADYFSINQIVKNFGVITLFGEKHRRTISWSDDGKQPQDEWLLCVSFPTGAYIFGNHYPQSIFKNFFNELKEYKPKYWDTHNHNLYYDETTAKDVVDNFNDIYKKYLELSEESIKQDKIDKLERELKQLKEGD